VNRANCSDPREPSRRLARGASKSAHRSTICRAAILQITIPRNCNFFPVCESAAVIPHYHAIIFRNHGIDGHLQIWEFLQRPADIRDRSRPGGIPMIHKIGREIQVPDLQFFLVHEFFKMIAYKFPRFSVRHSRFRVYQFHPGAL
jgi:hypothetical protein